MVNNAELKTYMMQTKLLKLNTTYNTRV